MAARKKFDAQLEALQSLRDAPDTEAARAELQRGLQNRSSGLVAVAANIIAKAELRGLSPELIDAFDRFMQQPEKSDKGCAAKTAIARALYRSEADCDELFLRGIRHVQREPVWGGKQDTAVELRATSALALVRSDYPDVVLELARLLADPEPTARVGAAQALGATRHVSVAVPLLRFKALCGDADFRVVGACLSSLLAADPDGSLPFVAELLSDADEERRHAAAIALGESRLEGAFLPLKKASEQASLATERKAPLLGLSLLRSDLSWGYLLDVVRDAPEPHARQALEALAVFGHDADLRARILSAAVQRGEDFEAFAQQALP